MTSQERNRVEQELRLQTRDTMTFALTLLYTGCRITEALNLEARHIDLTNHAITIMSLKKRTPGHFRSIPIPERLVEVPDKELTNIDFIRNQLKMRCN